MRERDFLNWVIAVAERFQWKVWHVPAPMRATAKGFVGAKEAAGLPDLILLHDDPPRLVFAELKGTGGKLSDEQRNFLQAAQGVAEASVARGSLNVSADSDAIRITGLTRTVGAYLWEPGCEDVLETILKSRVLI